MTMSRAEKTKAVLILRIEAERQSLLVSHRLSERETLDFITQVVDTQGWK